MVIWRQRPHFGLATRLRRRGFEPTLSAIQVIGYTKGARRRSGQSQQRSRPGPFCIVAHSLGGFGQTSTTDHSLNVERLIFVATPHAGNAVSRMARRTPFARLLDAVKRTATSFPNFNTRP